MLKHEIKLSPLFKPRHWVLLEAISFDGVQVLEGFSFDGASIPVGLRWKFPHGGAKMFGACLHDHLYRKARGDRKSADILLYRALISNGVDRVNAKLIYIGVRLGGWYTWNRNRRREHWVS